MCVKGANLRVVQLMLFVAYFEYLLFKIVTWGWLYVTRILPDFRTQITVKRLDTALVDSSKLLRRYIDRAYCHL